MWRSFASSPSRIFHVHMKDVWWSSKPTEAGVFGGHLNFGDPRRYWDFRSLGRGSINFEEIIRALNDIGYSGPLSVEWEDGKMDREHGAAESARSCAGWISRRRPSHLMRRLQKK